MRLRRLMAILEVMLGGATTSANAGAFPIVTTVPMTRLPTPKIIRKKRRK